MLMRSCVIAALGLILLVSLPALAAQRAVLVEIFTNVG
jgi:hypothetical protein